MLKVRGGMVQRKGLMRASAANKTTIMELGVLGNTTELKMVQVRRVEETLPLFLNGKAQTGRLTKPAVEIQVFFSDEAKMNAGQQRFFYE